MTEKGVTRWVVDISEWKPSSSEFTNAISFLPYHEHSSIYRYFKMEDRKRALVSRLLQCTLVHDTLGIPFDEIIIERTVEGKPYLKYDRRRQMFPNFNFSVSHHGDFVAIASEPCYLVGLDIVTPTISSTEIIPDYVNSFSSYFTSMEWHNIVNASSSDDMLEELYRYWSLKEAFTKAIGTGLDYRLVDLEFHHVNWTNISIKIHGNEELRWKFWHVELKKGLYVSVARGCSCLATVSFKQVLNHHCDKDNHGVEFNIPNSIFLWKTMHQLMPN